MTTRQAVIAALVFGLFCCALMWWLESFRQQKMIGQMRAWLETLPTFGGQETPS